MKKDINEEVNKLLELQKDIEHIKNLQSEFNHFVYMSQEKYDNLPEQLKMNDLMFYLFPTEIFEYIDEDIVLLENNKIFVIRNGECVNSIDLK